MARRMQFFGFRAGALLLCAAGIALAAYHGFGPQAAAADPEPSKAQAADEAAIRATADEFVKAFNAADGKAIASEWAVDAGYTDEQGQEFRGRKEIQNEYESILKAFPGATIAVEIESIRFLGPDTAIEKGITRVKMPKDKGTTAARYTVVHARRDGKWIIVVGHDLPYVSASNADYLKDLDWMIGEWKADGKEAGIRIKSEWMAQHNYIKNTYNVIKDGEPTLTGAQIIGWNPKTGKIIAWHFDANGGYGNDVWTKDGAKWDIEATGVFHDGSETTAVNIITPIDANSFTWQSVRRTLDGVRLPDVGPVKIVRVAAEK